MTNPLDSALVRRLASSPIRVVPPEGNVVNNAFDEQHNLVVRLARRIVELEETRGEVNCP